MDKEYLEDALRRLGSMKAVARELGCSPGTVSYWVGRHGLTSPNQQFRPHVDEARVQAVRDAVRQGWTLKQITQELKIAHSTLVRILTQEGMETARSASLRIRKDAHQAGLPAIDIRCHTHGVTPHLYRNSSERYRCAICASDSVSRSRRASKRRLVEGMGGECWICGYRRSAKSLQFHHIDPSTKSFNISMKMALSDARLRLEARKCALLCANCHGEVEAGEIISPRQPPHHLNVPIWDDITLDEALAA